MKMYLFNTHHSHQLKQGLNVYTKQIRANSKNIANIDNPNFKRSRSDFSEELAVAKKTARLRATNSKHILRPNFNSRLPGLNNQKNKEVNLNREMGELAQNQIRYKFATNTLQKHYVGLMKSIRGKV